MPNALVLVMDRLGSAYLGPYGNTWIDTPAWNLLASRSLLVENGVIDSPDLELAYRSFWRGRHALSEQADNDVPALADQLADHSVETWLVTDDPVVARRSETEGFHERVIREPATGEMPAADVEETQLARVFATVLDVLDQAESPFMIWVHAQSMQGPWDAPYALRCHFADEEDPEPPQFVAPPDRVLSDNCDPDELLGVLHAYAGQVSVLDLCLGILLDALWTSPLGDSTALWTTATRGYPLGEHGYIGRRDDALHGELIQVPWLMHLPDDQGATLRVPGPVQPPDLYATLLEWFELPAPEQPIWGRSLLPSARDVESVEDRDRACAAGGDQRALRVPAWFLRHVPGQAPDLFVKPDDRWEVNEVSDRCRSVVEGLLAVLEEFEKAARNNDRTQLTPLPEEVLDTEP